MYQYFISTLPIFSRNFTWRKFHCDFSKYTQILDIIPCVLNAKINWASSRWTTTCCTAQNYPLILQEVSSSFLVEYLLCSPYHAGEIRPACRTFSLLTGQSGAAQTRDVTFCGVCRLWRRHSYVQGCCAWRNETPDYTCCVTDMRRAVASLCVDQFGTGTRHASGVNAN